MNVVLDYGYVSTNRVQTFSTLFDSYNAIKGQTTYSLRPVISISDNIYKLK